MSDVGSVIIENRALSTQQYKIEEQTMKNPKTVSQAARGKEIVAIWCVSQDTEM